MLRMAAWRMWFGVAKSGCPTPSEITPSMLASRSKKRRIPGDGIDWTCFEMLPRCVCPSVILPVTLLSRGRTSIRLFSVVMSRTAEQHTGPEIEFRDIVHEEPRAIGHTDTEADALLLLPAC